MLEPGDQPQRRGLAGAGRPEQHEELAVGDGQRQVVDRLLAAEALGDAVQPDLSHAPSPMFSDVAGGGVEEMHLRRVEPRPDPRRPGVPHEAARRCAP